MGVPKAGAWLADFRKRAGPAPTERGIDPDRPSVGILAFEAAATMSRLVALHRLLSDKEVHRLRSETMRSRGVAYLNSTDQSFLLRLACAELMVELDRAAAAVARLGLRCYAEFPRVFDRVYYDLKLGRPSDMERLGLGSGSKSVEKRIKKIERYVELISRLHEEMERLTELEAADRRMQEHKWRYSGPIPVQKLGAAPPLPDEAQLELKSQQQKVRRLKDDSLWSKSYDKAVELMARAVLTVFVRICVVFGPSVPGLPPAFDWSSRSNAHPRGFMNFPNGKHSSGPLERLPAVRDVPITRNSAPIFGDKNKHSNSSWSQMLEVLPTTVGGSGLALRYAKVVLLAEKLFKIKSGWRVVLNKDYDDQEEEPAAREELYQMIPLAMQRAVRGKLKDWWKKEVGGGALPSPAVAGDRLLAEGWRVAVSNILGWLSPVAHGTLRWHEERNMDPQQRFDMQPRALMLQTFHFADAEKAEAAIVEVLVGLSCICWYDERRREATRR